MNLIKRISFFVAGAMLSCSPLRVSAAPAHLSPLSFLLTLLSPVLNENPQILKQKLMDEVYSFKSADPKLLYKGVRDIHDLSDPENTSIKTVSAKTDVDTRPVFLSYAFKTSQFSAYRVWTGERITLTVPKNEKVVMASTDFSSCAAVMIRGTTPTNETILEFAHLEAANPKGQLPRLIESLQSLRKQNVKNLQVIAHINPVNSSPEEGYYNVWPQDTHEIQLMLGPDVQLTVDRKLLKNSSQPEMTNVYATLDGIMVEYPHNPSLKPKFILWQDASQSPESSLETSC